MKKSVIYSLALFYQRKIQNVELLLSDTRYFRDAFKSILEYGTTIEKDRMAIVGESTELSGEQIKEINVLFNEEALLELNLDIERFETAGIKITSGELELFEANPPKEVKEGSKNG